MKSKEEIKNMVAGRRYGKKWEDVLFKEDLFDEVLEEYAQQSQPSGMRWVSASERLPDKYKTIVMRVEKMPELTGNGYSDGNVFWWSGPKKQNIYYNIQDVEWLDESPPAGAAEGASEGMAEALRECTNHGAFTFYCDTNHCICCSECKMPLTQSEFKEKFASLSSPGSGWVKVDYTKPETLPEFGVDVIVYAPEEKDPVIIDHCFKGADGNVYWDWCNNPDTYKPTVTHWRPHQMINANELRLGNWVDYQQYGNEPPIKKQVHGINRHHVWFSKTTNEGASIHLCEGIPLTPEVLEKCGFKKTWDWWELDSHDFVWHSFIFEDGEFYISINGDEYREPLPHIKHLHQLQNLHIALTGEELRAEL